MIPKSALPNALTASRIAVLPLLWYFALAGATRPLAIGLALAASTDFFDGNLARILHARSELGSRLDSIADHLLSASVLVWLVLLRPEFFTRHATALIAWAIFGALTLAVGWARFRRIGDLHLYSAKAAMVLGYLFVVYLFYFDSYDPRVFTVVLTVAVIATAESLLVYLSRSDQEERIGSILVRRRSNKLRERT
jgi:phosphatidylglycerophosphate synthase